MKFTKENVIKVFGKYMGFEDDDEMINYDDFVLEVMKMKDDDDDDDDEVTE